MTQEELDLMPALELYRVDAETIQRFAGVFTEEAVYEILTGDAIGMIAAQEKEVCGGICVAPDILNDERMDLLSLYVLPEYRRQGIGGTLFLEMMEYIFEDTDAIMHICHYVGAGNQDEEVLGFLKKAGFFFEEEEEDAVFVISAKDCKKAPLASIKGKLPEECRMSCLGQLSEMEKRRLFQTLQEASVDDVTPEGLDSAEQECSFVVQNEKGMIESCVILKKREESLHMVQFYIRPGVSTPGVIMLQAAADAVGQHYGEDAMIEIPVMSEASSRLMHKLLGDAAKKIPIWNAYFIM